MEDRAGIYLTGSQTIQVDSRGFLAGPYSSSLSNTFTLSSPRYRYLASLITGNISVVGSKYCGYSNITCTKTFCLP